MLGLDQLSQGPITKIESIISGRLIPVKGKLQRQIKISTSFWPNEGFYLDPKGIAYLQENLDSFKISNKIFQPNNDGTASFLIKNLEGTYDLRFPIKSLQKNPTLLL